MVSLRGRFELRLEGKLRSHGRVPGEPLSSKVCILLGCAVHVLVRLMVGLPRRVRHLIADGVRVVVPVRRCSGCALAQREGCGTVDIHWRCGGVVGVRWQCHCEGGSAVDVRGQSNHEQTRTK